MRAVSQGDKSWRQQLLLSKVITACRDESDSKFLELAVSGMASHIITGDKDLLVLHPFRSIAVITPQASLTSLLASEAGPGKWTSTRWAAGKPAKWPTAARRCR